MSVYSLPQIRKETHQDSEQVIEIDGKLWHAIEINGKTELVHFGTQWEPITIRKKGKLTKKEGRAFNILNSGLELGITRKERLIFMTLTTQYDKTSPEQRKAFMKSLNKAFTLLKQKIERKLKRLIYIKYCKKHHKKAPFIKTWRSKETVHYPQIWEKSKFKFKYFKVKTIEGGCVLHIVFRKSTQVTPKMGFQ
jgi:hypothetical protein